MTVDLAGTAVPLFARTYGGWDVAFAGMALGALLTVGVSLLTTPAADEDDSRFVVGAD